MIFSHSSEHYIRLYAQIDYGAKKADQSIKSLGFILHCFNCLHRETSQQPFGNLTCPECGGKMDYAGPLWLGDIFDEQFIGLMIKENQKAAFKNNARIAKLLALTKDEALAPLSYYVLDKLSGKLGLPSPSTQIFIQELRNSGFLATSTHFNSRGVRTSASALEMRRIMERISQTT